ncbi:MAG: YlbF family regulator [Hydrogenibacillus sp.]|nr:YlbF family regulator [Hydrogenibacillus sp.]
MDYGLAYELAHLIEASAPYQELKGIYQRIADDETSKAMLRDLRELEVALQLKQLSGEAPSVEDEQRYHRLVDTVRLNPEIDRLLLLEHELAMIYEDIQKILAEPFNRLAHFMDEGS